MDPFASDTNETYLQLKRRFSDFIHEFQPQSSTRYVERIETLLGDERAPGKNLRLLIDVHDIRQFDEKLHDSILKEPCESFRPCLDAARDAARGLDDGAVGKKSATEVEGMQVGFTGELGYHKVSPRKLLSTFLNTMVTVVGIVTKCTLVHPKLVKSVHYCKATNKFTTRHFTDETNVDGVPATSNGMPTRDENQNLLTTEIGLCHFVDNQRVTLQELPETAPPGQLPRSTEFVLEGDLVDACKPGDRVMITGVYRPLAGKASATLGAFRSVVVVNSVEQLSQTSSAASEITTDDLKEMKRLAAKAHVLDILGKSMAPSIYGHVWIKKALVLLLVGGQEKVLSNKTHLRGDINCLLVGDPGVAKSQLLRAVMNVAPLAISTNGRGSSGVGLTAAVTTDQETGDRRLEAGAVVLADRGLVCVDEFDKMSDVDRVAIHEVMEQQTVTISKAGIHTSLNARCSIVAAANPIYGNIDESISLTRNINLPDSLLSRFDLLFVVRDNTNEQVDLSIASHVLQQHRYRAAGDDGTLAPAMAEEMLEQDEEEGGEPPRYLSGTGADASEEQLLTVAFLRKYIYYSKTKFGKQILTQDAFEEISNFYVEVRQAAASGTVDPRFRPIPVTARLLETTIRVATAHSKLRFSRKIEKEDVSVARNLLRRIVDQSETVDVVVGSDDLHRGDVGNNQAGYASADPAKRPETRRQTRSQANALQDGPDDENTNDTNVPRVGQKRTTSGVAAKNPPRQELPDVVLDAVLEKTLYEGVSAMLVEQRYVDEWKVGGVQNWLKDNKSLDVPVAILEQYFDRVDQNIPENIPHVLYDVAEKTVHRDY